MPSYHNPLVASPLPGSGGAFVGLFFLEKKNVAGSSVLQFFWLPVTWEGTLTSSPVHHRPTFFISFNGEKLVFLARG